MLEDYSAAYGLRYVALRYFNASGADPSGELAERHDPETHLIPRALQAALGSLEALEVFGTDYPTADGTCVRDYIHVSDLANAHVLATRHLLEGGSSLKLNVGTGSGTSIRQVIDAIRATTDHAVPVSFGERRPGDPPALYADGSRARDLLGFTPVHSTIEAIVQTAAPTFRPERLHDRH
jgi:UDP-arabinose 4-epimerase